MNRKALIFSMAFIISQFTFQSLADSPGAGKEYTPPGTKGSAMVVVPNGKFMMGINPATDDRYSDFDDEKPYHQLYLDEYYIDKYETTVDQYNQCAREKKCEKFKRTKDSAYRHCNWNYANRGDHPINCLSWSNAKDYCDWAGKRLPTEAEWEKAARGTDGRKFPWGNQEATCDHAVFNAKGTFGGGGWGCGKGITWPVGSKPDGASPYGAMDMAGNVGEWVSDWYYEDYYRKGPDRNPKGPDTGEVHPIRGGGWNEYSTFIRTTYRNAYSVGDTYPGVRCVKSP